MNRLLSKLHLLAKIALFGILFEKFLDRMFTHALKIFQKICSKTANFFKQMKFRKKSNDWVFLNGEFYRAQEAKISVTDRGFLFGDGIFTTIRVSKGQCELWDEHLQRLDLQAKELFFSCPIIEKKWVDALIERNGAKEGVWRLKIIITAKQEKEERSANHCLMTMSPYQPNNQPLKLTVYPKAIDSNLSHLKTLCYLERSLVHHYATANGYDDAVTLTKEGWCLETAYSNIFWIDKRGCWIPSEDLPYLKGIFLSHFISRLQMPIHFLKFTLEQIPSTAHVYCCNALSHARSVQSINDRHYSLNPWIFDCDC